MKESLRSDAIKPTKLCFSSMGRQGIRFIGGKFNPFTKEANVYAEIAPIFINPNRQGFSR